MPDTIQRGLCRGCGRPIFRYLSVRVRKSPGDTETVTTWWFHHDRTFACEQRPADG